MKRALVALFTLGCAAAPRPPPAPVGDAAIRANPWFAAVRSRADLDALPGRAWLQTAARASVDRRTWHVAATATADDDGDGCGVIPVAVVARTRDAVQIVHDSGDALMSLWLDADDLVPVVSRATALWAAPPAIGDGPRGRVHVGAPVRVLERRGGYAQIALDHGSEYARGWVAARDLDVVSLPPRARPPRRDVDPRPPWTRRRLLAAPAVDAAELGGDGFVAWLDVVDQAGPWLHVRHAGALIDLDGWVEATAVERRPIDFDSHVGCREGTVARTHPILPRFFGPEATRHRALPIPRGTCLWASPDGPVVAVTTDAALRDFRRADRGAWWTTELATRWGAFVVGIPMDRRHPVVPASTCDAPPRAARVNAAAPGDAAAP